MERLMAQYSIAGFSGLAGIEFFSRPPSCVPLLMMRFCYIVSGGQAPRTLIVIAHHSHPFVVTNQHKSISCHYLRTRQSMGEGEGEGEAKREGGELFAWDYSSVLIISTRDVAT
jgi:hypothetical protein